MNVELIIAMLNAKDTVNSEHGIVHIDSYMGDQRQALKNALYQMVLPEENKSKKDKVLKRHETTNE